MRFHSKFILSPIVFFFFISINTNAFAVQDLYLKQCFTQAMAFFETQKYTEAILLFEEVIEIEARREEFYFTPFAELYIEKSKEKNVVIVTQKKKEESKVRGEEEKKKIVKKIVKKEIEIKQPERTVYDNTMDRYEEKQEKTPTVEAVVAPFMEQKQEQKQEQEVEEVPSVETETKIYSTFQYILNEKIEQGIENLDKETLEFFEDERFHDIVKEIKAQKRKR